MCVKIVETFHLFDKYTAGELNYNLRNNTTQAVNVLKTSYYLDEVS